MGSANETDEGLNRISKAAVALHAAAGELWLRWKIQGDKHALKSGAFAKIGRFQIEGVNGIAIFGQNGVPSLISLPGSSMPTKLEVLEAATAIFSHYGLKAHAFWADVDRILSSCHEIPVSALKAAEDAGPQR